MFARKFTHLFMVVLIAVSAGVNITGTAFAQNHGAPLAYAAQPPSSPQAAGILESGPDGGSVNYLVMDPKTPTTLYAATDYGVFKTTTNGDSWFLTGLISTQVYALAVDPVNPNNVYAGTRDLGFYYSKDGGQNWAESNDALMADKIIYTLAVDPANPNNVYAGGREANVDGLSTNWWGGGVFKSTDYGLTWKTVNNGLPEGWVYSIAIDPKTPTTIYVGTHSMGVYKTFDGGGTWAARTAGMANFPSGAPKADNLKIRSLAINPQNPNEVLVGVWGGNSLFRSENGAENGWENITKGIYGSQVRTVAIDPVNTYLFYVGFNSGGVYKNGNSGLNNWTTLPGQWGYFMVVNSIVINPIQYGNIFVAIDGAGVYRSTDGGATWAAANHGLTGTTVDGIISDPTNSSHLYASTYGTGVFESNDKGATWNYKTWATQWDAVKSMALDPNIPKTLYIATDNYGIAISQDNGASWSAINHNLPLGSPQPISAFDMADPDQFNVPSATLGFPVVYAVAAAPTNPTTLYAGTWGHGTWASKDGGISWHQVDGGNGYVTSILVYPNDPNSILVTTSNLGLIKAVNTGTGFSWNWANINQGLGSLNVQTAFIDGTTNPVTMYAGTTAGLFKSLDGGATWSLNGLADFQIDGIAINPTAKNTVFAATQQDGIYKTSNGGAYWYRFGLDTTPVYPLLLDPATKDILYTGVQGGGVIRFTQSQMIPVVFISNIRIKLVKPAAAIPAATK